MGNTSRPPGRVAVALALITAGLNGPLLAQCPRFEYAWTRTLGGVRQDHVNALAVDSEGSAIVTGYFSDSVDFDPTPGVDIHTSEGRTDIFVTKIRADGSYGWTYAVGGPGKDIGYGVAVDGKGDVVITGWFHSSVDFDPGEAENVFTAGASYEDVFVTKLRANGDFLWTRVFGASGSDRGLGVAVDSLGNVLATGAFQYTVDFDAAIGTGEHTSNGEYDVFVTKLAGNGDCVWTRTMGGGGSVLGFGVATDPDDHVLVTGSYRRSADFDPGPGSDVHADGGAFITKLHGDGSYAWTRTFGKNTNASGWDIASDVQGSAVVGGYYVGLVDFDPADTVDWRDGHGFSSEAFVIKLQSDGAYAWAYTMGGPDTDSARGVAVAPDGHVIVTGRFQRTIDFNPLGSPDNHSSNGWRDAFVTHLGSDGTYNWTRTTGSTGYDEGGYAVAVSSEGDLMLAGRFEHTVDFDSGSGIDEHQSRGMFDAFVTKLVRTTPFADCNLNGVADECDIDGGTSLDQGANGIPDECELPADFDGDIDVDLGDFWKFQACFTGIGGTVRLGCETCDVNGDTHVDVDDYVGFGFSLTGPGR